jgi:excisionase family DNA binding protein
VASVNPPRPLHGLLTTSDAAEYLQIHPKTLKRWVRAGRIPASTPGGRFYRFRLEDLDAFVDSSAHEPLEAS